MADERPTILKLDLLELTVLESVEVARTEHPTEPFPAPEGGDANYLMINAQEPAALSGYLPCE